MTPLPRPVWPGRRPKPDDYQRRSIESFVERQQALIDAEVEGQVRMARVSAELRQPRRITQLCGSAEGVHALCNDGTVWQLIGGVWAPEPGIPQRQLAED